MADNAKIFGRIGLEFTAEVQGEADPRKAMMTIRTVASEDAPRFMSMVVDPNQNTYQPGESGPVIEITELTTASCDLWSQEEPVLSEEQCVDQVGHYVPDIDASNRVIRHMAEGYYQLACDVAGGVLAYDQTVTGGENPILEKQLHGFLQMQRTALDNTSPAPNQNQTPKE